MMGMARLAVAFAIVAQPLSGLAETAELRPDQVEFRALYQELVETDTSATTGSCTALAAKIAADPADEGSTNAGATPIEMVLVTLKPVAQSAAAAPGGKPKYQYLNYPNIPGEDVLENDQVIVQRFTVKPGQWECVHAHCPDMLYIHIKGGQWAAKTYQEPERPYPDPSPDGEVGWMPTIDISVGHQSRNIGKHPIDLVWVTLKK
jgi:predicted component of type VI protein secretion system